MSRLSLSLLIFSLPLAASLCAQPLIGRLDSILATSPDTHQVRSLVALVSDFSSERRDIPDSLFDRALALAHDLNDDRGLAQLYTSRYVYCINGGGSLETGLSSAAQAIKHARASGQQKLSQKAAKYQVILLMISGNTEEAAKKATALAKEFQSSGNLTGEAEAHSLLSTLSSGFGNYELTRQYDSIAVALARRSKSPRAIGDAVVRAGVNLCMLGHPGEALPLAEEGLAIARKLNNEIEIGNALSVRAEANTALGNYAEALKDFELMRVGEGDQKSTWRMTNKGILLQRLGRHDEARALLLETVDLVKKGSNDPLELEKCYLGLQTVGLNQVQYDSVVWYGKLMEAQQDSLQTAKNIRNLLELEEKYKAEEKEAEIRFQQEELALKRSQLYITICGLLLAVVTGVTFFLMSRRLRKRNAENEQLVMEKETLIGEIHHRVKNNLQVVSSLLQIQRRGLDSGDEKGREALRESQNRVGAMGLIHNKLYQGKEVTSVHMPNYLKDLGETLLDAYQLEEQVEIFYDVADLRLDVDYAIPLGLIINELITNSLKYAFPKGREGTIEIALNREGDRLRLMVIDDGVGAAAAEKRADSTSFGNNLIGLLTKKLKGSWRLMDGKGYGVEILFKEN